MFGFFTARSELKAIRETLRMFAPQDERKETDMWVHMALSRMKMARLTAEIERDRLRNGNESTRQKVVTMIGRD